jgi:hypothetical protein
VADSREEAASETAGGWSVRVHVLPACCWGVIPGLSEVDRECLRFLALLQNPIPAAPLCRAMEDFYKTPFALISLKRSLARLKRGGLVGNRPDGPRAAGAITCATTSPSSGVRRRNDPDLILYRRI